MEIVVVANDESRMNDIVDQIVHTVGNVNVNSFTDPLLAYQYLFHNKVDMVFTDAKLKYLPGIDFVKLAKETQPDLDISVMLDDSDHNELLQKAGAERVIKEDVKREDLEKTIEQYQNSP